jgi:hypothetical protein
MSRNRRCFPIFWETTKPVSRIERDIESTMAHRWIEKMKQLAESLGILKSTMSRLNTQRDAAKAALEKARVALKAHLLGPDGGDKTTVAALKAEIVSERELLTALDDAIETQNALVVAEENRLLDEETRRQRTAASDTIFADVKNIESQIAPWLAATRRLANDLKKYESFRTECSGIAEFIANCAAESELALSVSIPDLRSGARAVLEGREPAPVAPGTVVKMPAPKPPVPTTQRFFLSRNIAFYDAQGGKFCAPSLTDYDLPVGLITKATEFGAIHAMDSDVRKKNHGGKSQSAKPAFEHCLWLNSDPTAKSTVAPIKSSHLGDLEITVGTPILGMMRSQPAMENTRSLPTKK